MLTLAHDDASTWFADLRRREFGRLDAQQHAYLDYTGSALYAESQLRAHQELLAGSIFGNPHSDSTPSRASTEVIESTRKAVLRFFNVDASTHEVCFTANASAAIKLVAESYPFDAASTLLLSSDNHNSVNGIREYALRAGASVCYLPLDQELRLDTSQVTASPDKQRGLLAFPAQSNFSGVKHPLSIVADAHAAGFDVLLDAAAFAPTNALDLRACRADFTVLSFYKMFGYPTGVGALIARREALSRLRRPWFAGGTVVWATTSFPHHRLREGAEGFEDGTPDFLSIAAIQPGLDFLLQSGMHDISAHVFELTEHFLQNSRSLRHSNGKSVVRIHGPADMRDRGATIAFDVCDRTGDALPYALVEARARQRGVSLRGGCFCNPGASEAAFGFAADDLQKCLALLGTDFSPEQLATCSGKTVGALRASFGVPTNVNDVERALDVIRSFRH